MKKFMKVRLFLCTLVFTLVMSVGVYAAEPIEATNFYLVLNGRSVDFSDSQPINVDGSTLLPLRFLFNLINENGTGELGYEDGKVTLVYNETTVNLWIGSKQAEINGELVEIEGAAPVIYNESTYVPLRFVADAFDMLVAWDAGNSTAYAMENELLQKIKDLAQLSSTGEQATTFASDIYMYINVNMSGAGMDVNSESIISGRIEQDVQNKYQHMLMNTESEDMSFEIETYDDGTNMYIIMDGEVMTLDSAFKTAEQIQNYAEGLNVLGSFEPSDMDYMKFNLSEDENGNYELAGEVIIPEDAINGLFQSMELTNSATQSLDGLNVKLPEPVYYEMKIDKSTGALTSMAMDMYMEMSMDIAGSIIDTSAYYEVVLENIQEGIEINKYIPEEILTESGE